MVSVLSNLSAASGLSGAGQGQDKVSAFSIEGLEHSLLSRGTVTAHSEEGSQSAGTGAVGFFAAFAAIMPYFNVHAS